MKNNQEIEKYCALCEHSSPSYESDKVICDVRGIVLGSYKCRKFIYDPQKHIPAKKILLPTEE